MREQAPTMSQYFLLVKDINMYANDDYEALTVNVEKLIEVITNYYTYECTKFIMETVENLNYRRAKYFSYDTFSKLMGIFRDHYIELEDMSKDIGKLISLEINKENQSVFEQCYKKLCDYDGMVGELSIDSFIEITTQQYMNINT